MIRQKTSIFLITCLFLFTLIPPSSAQDISNNTFGKGLKIVAKDSSMALKFGLRFSTLYEGFYLPETKQYNDNLLIRRFRLKFDGFVVSPKLVYKVEIGVSNRDIGDISANTNGAPRLLLDAVLKWNFANNFVLWFGQTKLPGNRERVVSSQKLQFVDRSLLNSRFNLDRDIGIQLHNHHNVGKAVFREVVSISKGEGRDITVKNKEGYDLTGRIEFLPFGLFTKKGDYFESDLLREPTPKLALGATYDYNYGASRSRGQLGAWLTDPRNLYTWFIDAVYKHNGFSATAEYADRQTEGSSVVERDSTGNVTQSFYTGKAFNGQMAYLFKNNFEIGGRYTMINQDPDTQREDIRTYTFGVSKYLVGHSLKLQSDITFREQENTPDLWLFRFQVEMAF
jgi:phosphate-selective porin OprO and OprP